MNSKPRHLLPNQLSIFRMILGGVIPFFILRSGAPGEALNNGPFWMAVCLFIFGALTDFWDGWIARRHRLETPLGRILDPTADKIFILAIMASLAAKGLYSYWILVPIFFREIAVTFSRIVWWKQGRAVGAERAGKLKFCAQVASIAASLVYLLTPNAWTSLANQSGIIVAAGLTVYSGWHFFTTNRELVQDPEFLRVVSSLGVGYLKPVPGTYGSLLGLALACLVAHDPLLHAVLFVSLTVVGYGALTRIGLKEGEDPLEVVIDETCGMLLAFWMVPLSVPSLLAGFVLFRLFDVTKLFPLNRLERLRGAKGIMADDLGAGILTWVLLKLFFR